MAAATSIFFTGQGGGFRGSIANLFAVYGTGFVLMSSTRLRGTLSLRLCMPGYRTREEDIRAVLDLVRKTAAEELS